MTNAFSYLRVSGLSQVDGDGFPRQLSACEKYAAKNGLQIIASYRDEGVTGKSDLDNRPALRECIAALLANGTRTLLIEKLDRLARDLMVQEAIVQDLQRKGITLISVAEPDLCSSDPTRTLMRQILGAFFQYERTMIVGKLKAARDRIRAERGKCDGRKSFGERPEEEKSLGLIINLSQQGMKAAEIAGNLNAEGIPTRSGVIWRPNVVAKILARRRGSQSRQIAPASSHDATKQHPLPS